MSLSVRLSAVACQFGALLQCLSCRYQFCKGQPMCALICGNLGGHTVLGEGITGARQLELKLRAACSNRVVGLPCRVASLPRRVIVFVCRRSVGRRLPPVLWLAAGAVDVESVSSSAVATGSRPSEPAANQIVCPPRTAMAQVRPSALTGTVTDNRNGLDKEIGRRKEGAEEEE